VQEAVWLRTFVVIVAGDDLLDPGHVVGGQVEVADHIVVRGLHDGVPCRVIRQEVRHGDLLVRERLG
jgi:hypothetical protein